MTESVLTILLIIAFFPLAASAWWFKTLDAGFRRAAATPLVAGLFCGFLLLVAGASRSWHVVVTGTLLTAAALYVRLTGHESEPAEGMLLGGVIGAAATAPLLLFGDGQAMSLAENLLAGAIAGFGVTFAAQHVVTRGRQLALDAVTALLAVGAAALLTLSGIPARSAAIGATAAVPLLVLATVFKQWPDIRAELRHEASLGFLDDRDVRGAAHPFLRFGSGGWRDRLAHRELVRLANRIALRKRQQRRRPDELARLYQLEIIKLRMQIQEMSRINLAVIAARYAEEEVGSDTMAQRK